VHGAAAASEIVNVWPPAVIVPVRAAPAFAPTLNATVPLPVPDPPLVIEIHDAPADAVHAHQVEVVTAKLPDPPPPSTDWLAGEMPYVHAAAACVMVNVWPPTVIVLLRAAPVFAATLNAIVPLPVPDPPLAIETHDAPADAVHEHQLELVTLKLPGPPPLSND